MRFSAAFGRAFGYYDGVLFEVRSEALGDDQPVAAGGRYDGLAARLGHALATGAVGCMVRPGRAWAGARHDREPLILAVPSKGRLKDQVEAWLADCGLPLRIAGGVRGYTASLDGFDEVQVRLASAGDIAAGLLAGEVHLGVTGEDLLREAGEAMDAGDAADRARLRPRRSGGRRARRAGSTSTTMADVDDVAHLYLARTGRRLRVATKYLLQTRALLRPARHRRLPPGRERRRHRGRAGGGLGRTGGRHHQHRRHPGSQRPQGARPTG